KPIVSYSCCRSAWPDVLAIYSVDDNLAACAVVEYLCGRAPLHVQLGLMSPDPGLHDVVHVLLVLLIVYVHEPDKEQRHQQRGVVQSHRLHERTLLVIRLSFGARRAYWAHNPDYLTDDSNIVGLYGRVFWVP